MQRVVAVTVKEPYQIWVRFADGVEGTIDLSSLIGHGVFAQLADPTVFAQVFVDPVTHTVAWPQEIDLCPDTLYAELRAKEQAA
ncbi:MAG: DUF2442 domain-containing protein [Armatimonadota bacterium]